jgi:hypothetical protein
LQINDFVAQLTSMSDFGTDVENVAAGQAIATGNDPVDAAGLPGAVMARHAAARSKRMGEFA